MKDLSSFLSPNLDIKLGDRTYSVPPPCYKTGLVLAAVLDVSTAAVNGQTVPQATQDLFDSFDKGRDIGELSLTPKVLEQMREDGVPAPDITMATRYALYYWVLGEASADAITLAQHGVDEAPKASTTSPSTGSESPTRTASTPATGSRTSSARKPRAAAGTASRGARSSSSGAQ